MNKIGLFVGTERGYLVLKELLKNKYDISNVLILEQQKHELSNYTNKIKLLCRTNNIPYSTSKKIKPSNYKDYLSENKPDIMFVVSWRFLISTSCFSIPKFGIFVLHDSLLPKYRGFSPTNWVIINGERQTGLTLQKISKNVDSGDIVDQIKLKIDNNDTATSLNKKFLKIYPEIIIKNIDKLLTNNYNSQKQNELKATYAAKRIPEDGKIDFNLPTNKIINLINGLSYPYPGAFCYYENEKIIVWEAIKLDKFPKYIGRINGKVVNSSNKYCEILTSNGAIRILKIARASKPSAFLKPNSIFKLGGNLI